jgi:hypothetical protein
MLFSAQLSSFSEQLFGILRAQSGHAYPQRLLKNMKFEGIEIEEDI